MGQTVKLRRSAISGKIPINSQLQLGELSMNTTDGKIFLSKSGSNGPSVEEVIITNTQNFGSIDIVGSISGSFLTGSFIGDGSGLYNIPATGVTGLSLDRIASSTSTASIDADGLHINTDTTVTGSLTATEFTGSGLGLTNVPIKISGSDEGSTSIDSTFTRIKFDDSTGIKISGTTGGDAVVYLSGVAAESESSEGRTAKLEVTSATSTWTLNHNLNEKHPSIEVFDSNDEVIIPQKIEATSVNQVVVSFASPQTGTVTATVGGGLPSIDSGYENRVLSVDNNGIATWKTGILSGSIDFSTLVDTGSFNTYTSSNDNTNSNQNGRLDSLEGFTSSIDDTYATDSDVTTLRTDLNTYSSSTDGRLDSLEVTSGSHDGRLDSIESKTGSFLVSNDLSTIEGKIGSLETTSGSHDDRIDRIETSTSSLNSFTSSINTTIKGKLNNDGVISGSIQIDHDATTNYVGNEHIDHSSITIGSGKGLTGGGTIDTNRSLTLDTGSVHFLSGVKSKLNTETVVSGSEQINITETTNYNLVDGRLDSIESFTSSIDDTYATDADVTTLRGDLNTYTSSNDTLNSTQDGRLDSLESNSGSYLTEYNDEYTTGATFGTSNGIVTFTRNDGDQYTVDLDGRYLTSFTETDPIFTAHAVYDITSTQIGNWDTAYGWGDHSQEGYLTTYNNEYTTGATFNGSNGIITFTRNDGDTYTLNISSTLTDINVTGGTYNDSTQTLRLNKSNGTSIDVTGFAVDTVLHTTGATFNSSDGVVTFTKNGGDTYTVDLDGRYLTSYSETDTLDSVVERGSVTDNTITVNSLRTNTDSTYDIGQNATRFLNGYFDNLHVKDKLQNNTASYINYISNQGHRFYVDGNNDDNSHKFQILSNTNSYDVSNVIVDIDQSGNATFDGNISGNNLSGTNTGDQDLSGYLTSFTETDPVFTAHVAHGITSTKISNWDTAYGWGDHSQAGYLTSYNDEYTTGATFNGGNGIVTFTRNDGDTYTVDLSATLSEITITGGTYDDSTQTLTLTKSDGNTVDVSGFAIESDINYFLTGATFNTTNGVITYKVKGSSDVTVDIDGRYLTSYSETDTLDSVTDRGNTTTNNITVGKLTSTWGEFTTTNTTNPGADDLNVSGYGIQGNRTSNPIYLHNYGNGGIRLGVNTTLGDGTNGVLITDTTSTFYTNVSVTGTLSASGYNDSNWNTAYGWGDHSLEGYLTSYNNEYTTGATFNGGNGIITFTRNDGDQYTVDISSTLTDINVTGGTYNDANQTLTLNKSNGSSVDVTGFAIDTVLHTTGATFNTGNGVITFTKNGGATYTVDIDGRFLTSYSETDTLDSVTDRGSSTSNDLIVGGLTISDTFPYLDLVDTNSFTDTADRFRIRAGGNNGQIQWSDSSAGTVSTLMTFLPDSKITMGNGIIFSATGDIDMGTNTITDTKVGQWNTAYGWGDHSQAGYVTSSGNTVIGTDSDINTSGSYVVDQLTMTDGVITSHSTRQLSELRIPDTRAAEKTPNEYTDQHLSLDFTDDFGSLGSWYSGITLKGWTGTYAAWQLISEADSGIGDTNLYFRQGNNTTWQSMRTVWTSANFANNSSNWNTAYGWGDHSQAGYITGYSETDTLQSVTDRGATTTNDITISNASTPKLVLKDTTNDLTGQVRVANSYMYLNIDSPDSVASTRLVFQTDGVTAMYLDQNQKATFEDDVNVNGNIDMGTNIITDTKVGQWDTAYGWGDHSLVGYLTSFTETYTAHEDTSTLNGNYGGGNNGVVVEDITVDSNGHVTAVGTRDLDGRFMLQGQELSDPDTISNGGNRYNPNSNNPTNEHYAILTYGNGGNVTGQLATHFQTGDLYSRGHNNSWSTWKKYFNTDDFTTTNVSNWNTAYGWGDHSLAGYTGDQDLSGYATETYVGTQIDNLIASAPGTLDTLNELAAALGDDPNFATTITTSIATKLPLAGGVMSGNIGRSSHNNGYLVGGYNNIGASASATNPIFTIGTSYLPAVTTLGNMYGIGYTRGDASFMGIASGTGWGMYVAADGDARIWLDGSTGNIVASGTLSASGYNDSNWNTAYGWGDHASAGYLTSYSETDTLSTVTARGRRTHSNGSDVWNATTPGLGEGNIHLMSVSNDHAGGAITFNASDANSAQAGIYVKSDGSYGTKMYIATTDSYATGSKTAISIDHNGLVNVTRGNNRLQVNGNRVHHAGDFTTTDVANGVTAYGWGDHSQEGYLTSSSTQSKYLRTDVDDTIESGSIITFKTAAGNARGYLQSTDTNDEHFIIATSGGEDIAFKDGGVAGTTNMIIRGDGNVVVTGSVTASGGNSGNWNTAYGWGNHASAGYITSPDGGNATTLDGVDSTQFLRSDTADSFTGTITMGTQKALVANNYGRGVYGLYSSTKYQHVWSMGTSYNLSDDGSTSGNLYGLAFTHTNVGGQSKSGLDHQLLVMRNGTTVSAIGAGMWTNGTITTTSHGTSADWKTAYGWGDHASGGYASSSHTHAASDITSGTFAAARFSQSTRYNIGLITGYSSQSRDKIRVWDSGSYSIGMKSGYDYGHIGSGEYAMSFQMSNTDGRGWWWGDDAHTDDQGAASLTTQGKMVIAKSLSIGEGELITNPSDTPLYVEGTTSGETVFEVQGTSGQLFSITDSLIGDIFEVSDISGIPILTVNSSGVVTVDDTLRVTGDVIAYYASDKRLKDNIKPIENAIDKIKMIGGYEFDWNSNSRNNNGHDVGVIAQEIEEVLPELVGTRGDGYKGVKYEKLTALLIQSNKELIARVEELESKLKK